MKLELSTALLLTCLAAGVFGAANPEGSGYLQLTEGGYLGVDNGYTIPSYLSRIGPVYNLTTLSGGIPMGAGLGLDAAIGYPDFFSLPFFSQNFHTVMGDSTDELFPKSYNLNIQMDLYPAAWFGRSFVSGKTANPDGWLRWPSVALSYSQNRGYDAFIYGGSNGVGTGLENLMEQNVACRVSLPWYRHFTVTGTYTENLTLDDFTADVFSMNNYGIGDIGLKFYIDLVPDAGSNTHFAYLPGYGRRGQLLLTYDYSEQFSFQSEGEPSLASAVALGLPLSAHLGLRLGWTNVDSHSPLYSTALTWAFGDPAGREDPR